MGSFILQHITSEPFLNLRSQFPHVEARGNVIVTMMERQFMINKSFEGVHSIIYFFYKLIFEERE